MSGNGRPSRDQAARARQQLERVMGFAACGGYARIDATMGSGVFLIAGTPPDWATTPAACTRHEHVELGWGTRLHVLPAPGLSARVVRKRLIRARPLLERILGSMLDADLLPPGGKPPPRAPAEVFAGAVRRGRGHN